MCRATFPELHGKTARPLLTLGARRLSGFRFAPFPLRIQLRAGHALFFLTFLLTLT
jgi:hypothetical protein